MCGEIDIMEEVGVMPNEVSSSTKSAPSQQSSDEDRYFSAGGIFAVYGDAGRTGKYSWCCLNYSRKQEILLKNLLQNQQNLKARGIYSCTGIYFFKSAKK